MSKDKPDMPAFGSPVKYTSEYRRKCKREERENKFTGRPYPVTVKYWDAKEVEGTGLFIGTRMLQNGVRHHDWEEGYTFSPDEHFMAALICPSPRRSPIYVPLDAVTEYLRADTCIDKDNYKELRGVLEGIYANYHDYDNVDSSWWEAAEKILTATQEPEE